MFNLNISVSFLNLLRILFFNVDGPTVRIILIFLTVFYHLKSVVKATYLPLVELRSGNLCGSISKTPCTVFAL